jgi:hypothetical protein
MRPRLAPRKAMYAAPGQILRPVVGLDIDGTSGEYHEHFAEYAEMYLQRAVIRHWDGSMPFWRCFGVSKVTYREMKLGYRQGRLKRSMPIRAGAAELARAVRAAGAELWVCTTRPWLRLDNIDPDTRFWLRNNRIQYDGVLFGSQKYRHLARLVGIERVVGVLDDEPEQCSMAGRAGLSAYLIDRPYNQNGGSNSRLMDLEQAKNYFVKAVYAWREERGV